MSKEGAVTNAESHIAKILRELEEATGETVEDISLHQLDITTFDSLVRQVRQSVRIDLARPVATRWAE